MQKLKINAKRAVRVDGDAVDDNLPHDFSLDSPPHFAVPRRNVRKFTCGLDAKEIAHIAEVCKKDEEFRQLVKRDFVLKLQSRIDLYLNHEMFQKTCEFDNFKANTCPRCLNFMRSVGENECMVCRTSVCQGCKVKLALLDGRKKRSVKLLGALKKLFQRSGARKRSWICIMCYSMQQLECLRHQFQFESEAKLDEKRFDEAGYVLKLNEADDMSFSATLAAGGDVSRRASFSMGSLSSVNKKHASSSICAAPMPLQRAGVPKMGVSSLELNITAPGNIQRSSSGVDSDLKHLSVNYSTMRAKSRSISENILSECKPPIRDLNSNMFTTKKERDSVKKYVGVEQNAGKLYFIGYFSSEFDRLMVKLVNCTNLPEVDKGKAPSVQLKVKLLPYLSPSHKYKKKIKTLPASRSPFIGYTFALPKGLTRKQCSEEHRFLQVMVSHKEKHTLNSKSWLIGEGAIMLDEANLMIDRPPLFSKEMLRSIDLVNRVGE